MAAQRVQASLREDGEVDRINIGQQVDENDQNEETARLAALERRLDQQAQDHRESEARMAQMLGQLSPALRPAL